MKANREHEFAVPAKLAVLVFAMLGVFLCANKNDTWMLALLAFFLILTGRQWRLLLSFAIYYSLLSLLMYLIRFHEMRMVVLTEFHIFMFWWLTPILIAAASLMTTPPGKLGAFFSKINAPSGVTLGMMVVFRFFPTMKTELRGIRESMYNRGLMAPRQLMAHPVASFEYMLVPMLMRCLQISDRLAVSAISRGIETPGKRESYYHTKMKPRDYLCILFYGAATLAILIWRGKVA